MARTGLDRTREKDAARLLRIRCTFRTACIRGLAPALGAQSFNI